MMAAIFAFRNNLPLLLNEVRLRYLDILSDYNVQIMLKSYHEINQSQGTITMKKLWTTKSKIYEYRQIVFDIVELYHLLTTQLSNNLMLTHHHNQSQHVSKLQRNIKNSDHKQTEHENEYKTDDNNNDQVQIIQRHNQFLVKTKLKSPFQSGSWLILGVPKSITNHGRTGPKIIVGAQSKLSMATTKTVQTVQSIIQHTLTQFVLFKGHNMTYTEYDKFRKNFRNDYVGKYNQNKYENNLIHQLSIISTRGIANIPNIICVGNRPFIIHCVGLKHWKLAEFLCKYYPLNILQFNNHNKWTPLIYAIIDNQIDLIRIICHIWANHLKFEMSVISSKLKIESTFDLLTHCDSDGNPTLLFAHSIECIDILCNQYDVDINMMLERRRHTLLICCVHRCLYDVVEYILNTFGDRVDVNIQNDKGNTAFMNAFRKIRDGNVKMIYVFLTWNEKMRKIDWRLRNKEDKDIFDMLKDAKMLIKDEHVYGMILDEMTKQSVFVQPK